MPSINNWIKCSICGNFNNKQFWRLSSRKRIFIIVAFLFIFLVLSGMLETRHSACWVDIEKNIWMNRTLLCFWIFFGFISWFNTSRKDEDEELHPWTFVKPVTEACIWSVESTSACFLSFSCAHWEDNVERRPAKKGWQILGVHLQSKPLSPPAGVSCAVSHALVGKMKSDLWKNF